MNSTFFKYIQAKTFTFHSVVEYNPLKDKIKLLVLSEGNRNITNEMISDTKLFTAFINQEREKAAARYLIGGYNELRNVYARSALFDSPSNDSELLATEEPRRLHLGIDIWGEEGSIVYSPIEGLVHSFGFNKGYGDYGATLILEHTPEHFRFYTLYGHLSLRDIENIKEGEYITKGQEIGHFGPEEENGYWPPHLHFQVMLDIGNYKGDYPGVCRFSERGYFLENCPNPDLILNLHQYAFMHK